MYVEIGKVSDATISQLKNMVDNATWEHHVSDVTDHQAAVCKKQVQAVDEITARWPVDTWQQLLFLRLRPNGKLYRHADEGFGFNIPVETNDYSVSLTYPSGISKAQHLEVGTIYRVDRSIEHESYNTGETDRTHLIVLLQ